MIGKRWVVSGRQVFRPAQSRGPACIPARAIKIDRPGHTGPLFRLFEKRCDVSAKRCDVRCNCFSVPEMKDMINGPYPVCCGMPLITPRTCPMMVVESIAFFPVCD